jgi:hypothetical protein
MEPTYRALLRWLALDWTFRGPKNCWCSYCRIPPQSVLDIDAGRRMVRSGGISDNLSGPSLDLTRLINILYTVGQHSHLRSFENKRLTLILLLRGPTESHVVIAQKWRPVCFGILSVFGHTTIWICITGRIRWPWRRVPRDWHAPNALLSDHLVLEIEIRTSGAIAHDLSGCLGRASGCPEQSI